MRTKFFYFQFFREKFVFWSTPINTFMKTNFIFLLILSCNFFSSQIITGKIFSEENNQPISYAKVGVVNTNVGDFTDESGSYKIDLSNVDKSKIITVQLGGYFTFEQKIQDFLDSNNYNIILKEKISDIAEIVINPKTFEDKNFGINSKKMIYGFSSNGTNANSFREFAIPFPNKKKLKVQKININIEKFETDKPIILNFNIYSNENNQPGKSILSENLTVELTEDKIKDGTFSYDLSDKSIWIDKEDFYVSVQVMGGFKGGFGFNAALLRTFYERIFYNNWEKVTMGSPAINIDVKIEKEKRHKK